MPDSSLHAAQKIAEPRDVEKPCGRIRPRRLDEDVVRVVAAQHVIDEVRRHGDLASRLLAPAVAALHQARNQRHLAERALHQVRFGEPGVEVVAQHVLGEELPEIEAPVDDHLR